MCAVPAYPSVMRTTCASIRWNDVKPSSRCQRASRSCPKACSAHGIRAIASTWTSSRSDATSPVTLPSEVSVNAPLPNRS